MHACRHAKDDQSPTTLHAGATVQGQMFGIVVKMPFKLHDSKSQEGNPPVFEGGGGGSAVPLTHIFACAVSYGW